MQKSQSLLLPSLEIQNKNLLKLFIVDTFVGNKEYEGGITWGNYLYVQIKNTIPKQILTELREHLWYETEYDPTEESIMVVFKPDESTIKNIFRPFIQGKYSKMDASYMAKHFSAKTADGSYQLNWKIFNRDPALKTYWEDRIGLELPEGAEVWNAPKIEEEVYGYYKDATIGIQL